MIVPALVVAVALAAPAAPKKTVVLVKTAVGVPTTWREELRAAVESAELKNVTFVPPPAVSLEDAATALGCASFNDGCAGQVANMTGAGQAMLVEVASSGGGADLAVRLVSDDGKLQGGVRKVRVEGLDAEHLELAKALVRAAAADKPVAMLWVDTELPGAQVSIDGIDRGTTPLSRWLTLEPGEHTMVLTQEGRAPLTVALSLKPYESRRASYELSGLRPDPALKPTIGEPAPAKVIAVEPAQPPQPANSTVPIIGYTVAGVGGVVALVGLGLTTAWVSGYAEASGAEAEGKDLETCLGLCDNESGFGLGISGPAREAYRDGSFSAWIGASIATLGVGALLAATGAWLAITGGPGEEGEAAAP